MHERFNDFWLDDDPADTVVPDNQNNLSHRLFEAIRLTEQDVWTEDLLPPVNAQMFYKVLSEVERQVLELLVQGNTVKQIAKLLQQPPKRIGRIRNRIKHRFTCQHKDNNISDYVRKEAFRYAQKLLKMKKKGATEDEIRIKSKVYFGEDWHFYFSQVVQGGRVHTRTYRT